MHERLDESPDFRALRVFNDPRFAKLARSRTRIGRSALPHFQEDTGSHRLIRELAHERAIAMKEIVEAFEFFAVVRKYVRKEVMVDLCSGHGLAGVLFALLQRETRRVVLCDRRQPDNHRAVLRATLRAAPALEGAIEYREGPLDVVRDELPVGAGFLGVHACGALTDTCLDIAAEHEGPVAVLPCCRAHALNRAPQGLRHALGEEVAFDVQRTYDMEARGYQVRWRAIPEAITPMNRVLIATPPKLAMASETSD